MDRFATFQDRRQVFAAWRRFRGLLLAYGDYTLETSLWVGLVLLVLAVLLLYGMFALLRRLLGGRKSLAGWWDSRRVHKAARLTRRGVINYGQGNWARARCNCR